MSFATWTDVLERVEASGFIEGILTTSTEISPFPNEMMERLSLENSRSASQAVAKIKKQRHGGSEAITEGVYENGCISYEGQVCTCVAFGGPPAQIGYDDPFLSNTTVVAIGTDRGDVDIYAMPCLAEPGGDIFHPLLDLKTLAKSTGETAHAAEVISMAWNAAGDRIVTCSLDKCLRLWNVGMGDTGTIMYQFKDEWYSMASVCFLPAHPQLFAMAGYGLRIVDSRSGREVTIK